LYKSFPQLLKILQNSNEFNRFETGNERALDLNSIIPRQARVQLERYLLSIGFNTMKNLEKWTPKGASVGS